MLAVGAGLCFGPCVDGINRRQTCGAAPQMVDIKTGTLLLDSCAVSLLRWKIQTNQTDKTIDNMVALSTLFVATTAIVGAVAVPDFGYTSSLVNRAVTPNSNGNNSGFWYQFCKSQRSPATGTVGSCLI